MRKFLVGFVMSAVLLLGLAVPSSAQVILNNTTLSAAMNATQTTASLTSTSTVVAGQYIVVAGTPPEAMIVVTVPTSGPVTVRRGQGGTRATAHSSATRVFTGSPARFKTVAPDTSGPCQRNQQGFLPWIDLSTGIIWSCSSATPTVAGTWRGAIPTELFYSSTGIIN